MPTRELVSRDAHRIALGGRSIEYVLERRRGRRGVGLRVNGRGLSVSAPVAMPLARVEALVRESESWVLRKVAEWSGRRITPLEWSDGAKLPWLGGFLTLRVAAGTRARAVRDGTEIRVVAPPGDVEAIRRAVVRWYKSVAHEVLSSRVEALARAAQLAPPKVFISPARTRWGSCNTRREVRLAWRLVKAPPDLADYVICHELAHLRHMNHSRAFWNEVERQCPGYRGLRAELHATDHLYRSF
ncbi:MAG TPA: SprT family zinc-dependent metalloprotease [Usitatibacter sp.]|nr:SprT family zinc-dependent metalloprotease [Usitatibacter sp.]